jgi:hypothetical protein
MLVGPRSIGSLIDQLLALRREVRDGGGRWLEEQSNRAFRLRSLIARTRLEPFIEAWLARATNDPDTIQILADLLAIHGGPESENSTLQLGEPSGSRVMSIFHQYANALLSSPEATRHQMSELTRAISRVASPALTDVVCRLCAEDLMRWRRAREERMRNPVGPMGPDVAMSYTRVYSNALSMIGDDKAIEQLKDYLTDPLLGHDAALALRRIWEKQQNIVVKPRPLLLADFSEVKTRREERRAGLLKTSQLGEAIFAVVEDLAKPARSEAEQRHALALATVAFTMPYAGKTDLIESLLALNLPLADKQNLLIALAMAGEPISADLVLKGIREFLDTAEQRAWMLRDNLWQVNAWMQLLPLSDRPAATLEALDLLPENLFRRWNLHEILFSVANAPDQEAEYVLIELAKRDPDLLGDSTWVDALLGRATDSAYRLLFDLLCDPNLANGQKIEGYVLAGKLSDLIRRRPDLRSDLLHRYQDLKLGHCHSIIEEALAKSPDEGVVLALVRSYSKQGKPFDQRLRATIESVALEQRPAPGWKNAYELYGVAVPDLRKQLFAMTLGNDAMAGIAAACLTEIDKLRDEHGSVDSEPRHPDIETGRSWPLEIPSKQVLE